MPEMPPKLQPRYRMFAIAVMLGVFQQNAAIAMVPYACFYTPADRLAQNSPSPASLNREAPSDARTISGNAVHLTRIRPEAASTYLSGQVAPPIQRLQPVAEAGTDFRVRSRPSGASAYAEIAPASGDSPEAPSNKKISIELPKMLPVKAVERAVSDPSDDALLTLPNVKPPVAEPVSDGLLSLSELPKKKIDNVVAPDLSKTANNASATPPAPKVDIPKENLPAPAHIPTPPVAVLPQANPAPKKERDPVATSSVMPPIAPLPPQEKAVPLEKAETAPAVVTPSPATPPVGADSPSVALPALSTAPADTVMVTPNVAPLQPANNPSATPPSPATAPVALTSPSPAVVIPLPPATLPVAATTAAPSADAKPVPVEAASAVPDNKVTLPETLPTAQPAPAIALSEPEAKTPLVENTVEGKDAGMEAKPVKVSKKPKIKKKKPAQALSTPSPITVAESYDAPGASWDEESSLSRESRHILARVPSNIDGSKKAFKQNRRVAMDHTDETISEIFPDEGYNRKNAVGISIQVKRPNLNVNYELEKAYDALIAGQRDAAIEIYKNVLATDPDNKLGLFGLATTYHRGGQIAMARPLYGRLLVIDPTNREALNNFLALIGEESPEDALEQLQALRSRNPDFSPIPAQMSVIYDRMQRNMQAVAMMREAIALSPENLSYRYNLAVMFDKAGDRRSAAALYQDLITTSERGEVIPGDIRKIQERLTIIRSNAP